VEKDRADPVPTTLTCSFRKILRELKLAQDDMPLNCDDDPLNSRYGRS